MDWNKKPLDYIDRSLLSFHITKVVDKLIRNGGDSNDITFMADLWALKGSIEEVLKKYEAVDV